MKEANPEDHGGYDVPSDAGIPIGQDSGLVDCWWDAEGNPLSSPEKVNQAEFDRRWQLRHDKATADFDPNAGQPNVDGGGGGGGTSAPRGPAQYKFDPVPVFNPPDFQWGETFTPPTLDQAKQDPGYEFSRSEGLGALQASQAAKGILRTGGSLKDLIGWGNRFAEQNYGNVFDRYARGYDTRFNTAKDKFQFQYTGAKDAYAPKLFEWQTKSAFGSNAAQRAWERMWDSYFHDTLSASDIYGSGQ